jgi:sorbitol/mannitol transport system permease protein
MANRTLPRLLQAPAVIMLLLWMLVPLGMTLFFSFIRYVLNSLRRPEWTTPSIENWRGLGNYKYVLDAKDFWFAIQNSVFIVVSILIFTVIFGLLIAVLVNRSFPGRGIVRVLLISPFFVMPAVNAVLWINMILDPVLGLNGLAVAGINDLVVARVKANLFPRQPDLCLCCDNDGHMAVDALCGSYFHDLLAV